MGDSGGEAPYQEGTISMSDPNGEMRKYPCLKVSKIITESGKSAGGACLVAMDGKMYVLGKNQMQDVREGARVSMREAGFAVNIVNGETWCEAPTRHNTRNPESKPIDQAAETYNNMASDMGIPSDHYPEISWVQSLDRDGVLEDFAQEHDVEQHSKAVEVPSTRGYRNEGIIFE